MDYFANYSTCEDYYRIYNKNLKCGEYLIYVLFTTQRYDYKIKCAARYLLNNVLHNPKGPAFITYKNGIRGVNYFYIHGQTNGLGYGPHILK